MPGTEYFRHGPGLRDAPSRGKRGFRVKYLAEGSQTVRSDLLPERFEKTHRQACVAINTQVRLDERPHEPAPHRALMISGIALPGAAPVAWRVPRFSLSQAPKSVRCDQPASASIYDTLLLCRTKRTLGQ